MDFFKLKRFKKPLVLNAEKDLVDAHNQQPILEEERKNESEELLPKTNAADPAAECEEDDDDFITNEVKRRLKELRRNSFMVLIPEDSCPDYDSSSSDLRESETEEGRTPGGLSALHDKYCERMLVFDKVIAHALREAASRTPTTPSPKSASKKLASTLRTLSLKRREELYGDGEQLQAQQQEQQDDPYQDLETAYVAHVCLSWEALHCQYMQLYQIIASDPDNPTSYGYAAQQFQQFQVLLQRFIENEPFEQGNRVEIYARSRSLMPKLLQVPNFQGLEGKENGEEEEEKEEGYMDSVVLANDLRRIIESSILTFHLFVKIDKKRSGGVLNLFGGNQVASTLQLVQASLDKKEMKLKELRRKKKGWKKDSWPATIEEVELLFGLIDTKIASRVLRMVRISKEQLLWCEEKMSKLDAMDSKFQRDGSPVLFPC